MKQVKNVITGLCLKKHMLALLHILIDDAIFSPSPIFRQKLFMPFLSADFSSLHLG